MEKKPQNTASDRNEDPAPQGSKWPDKTIIRYITRTLVLLIVFAWALVNLDAVLRFLGKVLALFTPFLIGGAIAFLINVVLRPLECCWNKVCRKTPAKLARPVCLTASTVLVLGILFAILITVTFGFAFNSVQSNTICAAVEHAFGISHVPMGIILTGLTLLIIFGGIQRIAKVSSIIVPVMALGYVGLALVIVLINITHLPDVIGTIVSHAFGWQQALGGGVAAALMQGIKRGLFSNEAGMGSAPNVAATAFVSHPVKQGLIQTLGVFTDTLIICSCTAFIILFSGAPLDGSTNGVQLTFTAS